MSRVGSVPTLDSRSSFVVDSCDDAVLPDSRVRMRAAFGNISSRFGFYVTYDRSRDIEIGFGKRNKVTESIELNTRSKSASCSECITIVVQGRPKMFLLGRSNF